MRAIAASLALVLTACAPARSAPAPAPIAGAAGAEADVLRAVDRLFDAMRAGDSTTVRGLFHPGATLVTIGERDGAPVLRTGELDAFVTAVGTPHDEIWDERIANPVVHVDGRLATAWMDYTFLLGDRISHCGVNAFHLFHAPEGWRIFHIADTRRRTGCEPFPPT